MEYILEDPKDSDGCVFCLPEGHLGPLPERLVLWSDPTVFVMMNRYPYNNAHLLVAPRRHVATLADATPLERSAIIELTAKATRALEEGMSPDGFNMGVNQGKVAGAGISEHLHLHITPRYNGDTNYMTVIGETRVIPEHLRRTYEKLVGLFN
ncbi:MAG: HIT domain-containing protein [Deltaproteobacteria bacterium]|jgi:ATP adenylyltransferase|nr:HIT domain-containing protein [Deltaproteobacteria bacterium]